MSSKLKIAEDWKEGSCIVCACSGDNGTRCYHHKQRANIDILREVFTDDYKNSRIIAAIVNPYNICDFFNPKLDKPVFRSSQIKELDNLADKAKVLNYLDNTPKKEDN